MADFLTPAERSERMSRIRSRDTVPELALRRALHAKGFRFRLGTRSLPGRPDIVLRKHQAVVFVHGCFWHRHQGCSIATTPKTRTDFWAEKFRKNVQRDVDVAEKLRAQGWRVLVAWECELAPRRLEDTVQRIANELVSSGAQ